MNQDNEDALKMFEEWGCRKLYSNQQTNGVWEYCQEQIDSEVDMDNLFELNKGDIGSIINKYDLSKFDQEDMIHFIEDVREHGI